MTHFPGARASDQEDIAKPLVVALEDYSLIHSMPIIRLHYNAF